MERTGRINFLFQRTRTIHRQASHPLAPYPPSAPLLHSWLSRSSSGSATPLLAPPIYFWLRCSTLGSHDPLLARQSALSVREL